MINAMEMLESGIDAVAPRTQADQLHYLKLLRLKQSKQAVSYIYFFRALTRLLPVLVLPLCPFVPIHVFVSVASLSFSGVLALGLK